MSDTIFLSFMFFPYDQFCLGQIPVLCTAQMNKNSQNPQRSAFNFSKTSLILTASNKMAACLTPGRKETGAEVASFPPFSPLAGDASLWPITTKIELTRTKWVGREKIPPRLEDLSAIVTFRGLALHRKKTSEKLFECTRKNDEWQIWWRAFISEKNKWKQNEKRLNTHLQYLGLSTDR